MNKHGLITLKKYVKRRIQRKAPGKENINNELLKLKLFFIIIIVWAAQKNTARIGIIRKNCIIQHVSIHLKRTSFNQSGSVLAYGAETFILTRISAENLRQTQL